MELRAWPRWLATVLLGAAAVLASGAAFADPPYRVARLSYAGGAVSFSPGGEEGWSQAVVNRPMFDGDRLWVDASSLAELELGATRVRAGEDTSLSVLAIDNDVAQLELTQGSVEVRVWRLDRGQEVELDTPNLAMVIREPGNYRLDVDGQDGSTGVTVRAGSATLYGEGHAFVVGPGDGWRFYDTALSDYDREGPPPPDALSRFAARRDARWQRSVSARYVPRDMIGFDDLDANGTWRQVPQYGWVWTPTHVASDWAPYRDGHWAWVDPWGWTWIDDAPWGFAPSHYGRWAFVQQRWCWVPGPRQVRPVYAPALVVFLGGLSASIGSSSGGVVGWFPLGPREVYRPSYPASREYFTRVNVTNTVVNVTQVTNVYERHEVRNVYINQRAPNAVVAVPTQVFAQAKPVAREVVRVRPQQLQPQAVVKAIVQAPPVVPARQSVMGPQEAKHQPPPQAIHREVVAQRPPPPPRAAIESRQQQLRQHPGMPAAPASRPAAPAQAQAKSAMAPAVKVIKPAQPAAAPPPPAPASPAAAARRQEREQRHEQQPGREPPGRGQPGNPPPAAPPAKPQPPTPAPAPAPAHPAAAAAPAPQTPAPARPGAGPAAADQRRGDERSRGEERQRERPAPGQRPPAAAPATPPAPEARPAPTPPAAAHPAPAAPTPPAPAAPAAPAARPPEAVRPPQAQQQPRREQPAEQRQQREEQRREPAPPAARPAPAAAPAPQAPPPPAARPTPPAPPQPPAATHPAPPAPTPPAPAARAPEPARPPQPQQQPRREQPAEQRQQREEQRREAAPPQQRPAAAAPAHPEAAPQRPGAGPGQRANERRERASEPQREERRP